MWFDLKKKLQQKVFQLISLVLGVSINIQNLKESNFRKVVIFKMASKPLK